MTMKMTVWHAKEPNFGMGEHPKFDEQHFEKVAELSTYTPEDAFHLTNHIDKEWWKNSGIFWHKPQSRSTSVGDVIVQEDGKQFRVDPVGMSEFSEHLSKMVT